jgi:hypothetical protein
LNTRRLLSNTLNLLGVKRAATSRAQSLYAAALLCNNTVSLGHVPFGDNAILVDHEQSITLGGPPDASGLQIHAA